MPAPDGCRWQHIASHTRFNGKINSTQGLHILFELKKRLDKGAMFQAMGQLLAANILSRKHRPVVVVTDLKDDWRLLWMDKATITTASCPGAAAAVAIIKAMVAQVGHRLASQVQLRCTSVWLLALPCLLQPTSPSLSVAPCDVY